MSKPCNHQFPEGLSLMLTLMLIYTNYSPYTHSHDKQANCFWPPGISNHMYSSIHIKLTRMEYDNETNRHYDVNQSVPQ